MLTAFKNKVVGLLINHKRLTLVLSVFFVSGLVFFAFSDQTLAATGDSIARLISLILEMVINFMGKFILLLFNLLVGRLAPYNNFIDARAVQVGWVLTRDISNMFFILVLLAIAFGTILKIEQLNYQKVLPKLLIMAVVINFSKTICGLVIDFGQVVMLTFVNAFVAAAGGNFLNALGLSRLLTLSESGSLEVSDWNLVGAFLLALTMMIIALIVVVVFIIVLAYRIVILWVLVILSPLAFLAGGFPVGKASQAYSQWWDNFTGAVIIGPILAFFLWLALLTAGGGTLSSEFPEAYEPTTEEKTFGELGKAGENYFL
ncbi:hypothetical protein KJ969_04125, partial [Patescibacteria group bacterium]|nr:hypothetical protein [Patescibacteria group bacterium]MBU1921976.1 hypothetical protein [Patescibacteria group bacterium]